MPPRILPPAPDGSELDRWSDQGSRRASADSNLVSFRSPDGQYTLSIQVDDPVQGYLVQLHASDRAQPLGRTIVAADELALQVAVEMAAAAADLDALADRPRVGADAGHREDVQRGTEATPDEWDDDEAWQDALEDAVEKAAIPRGKGTITTKTIDGRDYYYLQWREGESVKSQYIAPVSPA